MNETPIQITGNLTADPELRHTPSGTLVTNLRVASNPRRYDRQSGQWVDGETSYLDVEVWFGPAENVTSSLRKGDRVVVLGTIRTKTWQAEGGQRSKFVVVASEVGASLRFAVADVQKVASVEPETDEPPF